MDEELDLGFEEQILEPQPEEEPEALVRAFATVGEVYADGLSLIFDGETEPTEKHYLCNTSVYFQAGDRVRLAEDSGTYIVEYVVGPPKQARTVGIPAGGTTGLALIKTTDDDYSVGWGEAKASRLSGQYQSVTMTSAAMHGELAPNVGPSASNGVDLGTSTYPFKNCWLGGQFGAVHIGGNNTNSKISFFGNTENPRQTLSLSSNNMNYSSVTANNYLYALNNLIGILKNKYGLIL